MGPGKFWDSSGAALGTGGRVNGWMSCEGGYIGSSTSSSSISESGGEEAAAKEVYSLPMLPVSGAKVVYIQVDHQASRKRPGPSRAM